MCKQQVCPSNSTDMPTYHNQLCHHKHWYRYISHYWLVSLNKYACHITQVCSTALIMYSYMETQHYCTWKSKTNKQTNQKPTPFIYHICANSKYAPQMPLIRNIWDIHASIYTSYNLSAINNANTSTGIQLFYIIDICLSANIPVTLHICHFVTIMYLNYGNVM